MRIVFPLWDWWKSREPVLQLFPILLPFCWLKRVVQAPFRGNFIRLRKQQKVIGSHDDYSAKLDAVGLKYDW